LFYQKVSKLKLCENKPWFWNKNGSLGKRNFEKVLPHSKLLASFSVLKTLPRTQNVL
jgi:hypothetical protein